METKLRRLEALAGAKAEAEAMLAALAGHVPASKPGKNEEAVRLFVEFEAAKAAFYALDKYLSGAREAIRRYPEGLYVGETGLKAMLAFQKVVRTQITEEGKELCRREGLTEPAPVTNIKILVVGG